MLKQLFGVACLNPFPCTGLNLVSEVCALVIAFPDPPCEVGLLTSSLGEKWSWVGGAAEAVIPGCECKSCTLNKVRACGVSWRALRIFL